MDDLGTVLMIWAHPDDETYLAGGLSAMLSDAGNRVVCVTATRGEAGVAGADSDQVEHLAEVRTDELEGALRILGVHEHHWLDHPDGGCADVDPEAAADRIASIVAEVDPDTVVTFGPDGFTGHPDHRAVSTWTDLALAHDTRSRRLWHPVAVEEHLDWDIAERFDVYALGRPRLCLPDEVDLLLSLEGSVLDRKVDALVHQVSQTAGVVEAIGLERFSAWVDHEAFARPQSR